MRLGTYLHDNDPDVWADMHVRLGYSAACVPTDNPEAAPPYLKAAKARGLVMAEVGAWSNPISRDDEERRQAVEKCCRQLHLADVCAARCCVNIAGSRGKKWDGPDPANLTQETFDIIVDSVRTIIDTVKPTRTFYTLETMPWVFPDSPDSYANLIRAIDRPRFGVHLDVVNMVNCPSRAYRTGDFIRECFQKLGPQIKCCHAKDICFSPDQGLTLHLDECRPGTGLLDYAAFLREVDKLDPDMPVLLEHLPSAEEYALAAQHIRKVAADVNVRIR